MCCYCSVLSEKQGSRCDRLDTTLSQLISRQRHLHPFSAIPLPFTAIRSLFTSHSLRCFTLLTNLACSPHLSPPILLSLSLLFLSSSQIAPDSLYAPLFSYLLPSLPTHATHPAGNFCVQRLLQHLRGEARAKECVSALGDHVGRLLGECVLERKRKEESGTKRESEWGRNSKKEERAYSVTLSHGLTVFIPVRPYNASSNG